MIPGHGSPTGHIRKLSSVPDKVIGAEVYMACVTPPSTASVTPMR